MRADVEHVRTTQRRVVLMLEEGLMTGSLRIDTRLRDALRERLAQDAAEADRSSLISDSIAVRDADVVRLRRYLDGLAVRVAALEDG